MQEQERDVSKWARREEGAGDAGQSFRQWEPPRRPSPLREPVRTVVHGWRGLWDSTERAIREAHAKAVVPANQWESILAGESDESLRKRADLLRERATEQGYVADGQVGEGFALVREAAKRELGVRLYDVQLVGGYVLHQGSIAEMKTGEGKTFVAMLPSFLSAMKGESVHIVTVNDYLADRDANWVGRALERLGVTVGVVQSSMPPTSWQRMNAYNKDVTYVTNQEVGFDYLRDNMAVNESELVQRRPFGLAIVDEVDSVLIDESRNPLIISSLSEQPAEKFFTADEVAQQLQEGRDYTVNRKQRDAELTEEGMERAERIIGVDDVWDEHDPWARYVINAVKAREHYVRDKHYLVRNNEVHIVDEFTGRVMPRRRWSDNIHQAVEAKEGVPVQGDQATAATITYQCFFQLYAKLAGMTGTARTEAGEFWSTYSLDVVSVPTHKPSQRDDQQTAVFRTARAKWAAITDFVSHCYEVGRPILVGTTSVEHSEHLASLLDSRSVPYALLNARPQYAAQEAKVVAQAGRVGSVTIATNMAGRGTDIILGGNPEMLAQAAVEYAVASSLRSLCGLSHEGLTDDSSSPFLDVALRPATEAALSTAADLIAREKMSDIGGEDEISEAEDLASEVGRRLVAVAKRAARGSSQPSEESMPVAEKAGVAAAEAILEDCERQCEKEAAQVRDVGGLQILGTELHDSRRVDNQLRGRAGRQGDPGSTVFVISLEDELLALHCPEWLAQPMWRMAGLEEDLPIRSRVLDFEMSMIQRRVESFYASSRRQIAAYDAVLDSQRRTFYTARRAILATENNDQFQERMKRYMQSAVDSIAQRHGISPFSSPSEWDIPSFFESCRRLCAGREDRRRLDANEDRRLEPSLLLPGVSWEDFAEALQTGSPLPRPATPPRKECHPVAFHAYLAQIPIEGEEEDPHAEARWDTMVERTKERAERIRKRRGRWAAQEAVAKAFIVEAIAEAFDDACERLVARGADEEHLRQAMRMWTLRAFDEHWQQHLDAMQQLRNSVNIRSFGMMEPLEEYAIDGNRAFAEICESLRRRVVEYLFFFVDVDGASVEEEELAAAEAAAREEHHSDGKGDDDDPRGDNGVHGDGDAHLFADPEAMSARDGLG